MSAQLELPLPKRPGFHWAKIETSQRLQRAHKLMLDGQWRSTREIDRGADVCAVNAVIPELEKNGAMFERERRGRYFYYRMTSPCPRAP